MARLIRDRPKTYMTDEGDMADEIAALAYGDRPDGLVMVLKANPGLCRYPPMLPADIRIVCPDLPDKEPAPAATVRIFT